MSGKISRRKLGTMYNNMINRNVYIEALLYHYAPKDPDFDTSPDHVINLLKVTGKKIMEARKENENE